LKKRNSSKRTKQGHWEGKADTRCFYKCGHTM